MTEAQDESTPSIPAPSAETSPDSAPGFGAQLRTERERQSLTIGDMVARLRLHPNQVRAIEEEDVAALPGPAYVRGFVRSYARNLGLAPEPLLADVARKLGEVPVAVDAMADDSPRSPVRDAAREQNSRRVVLIGAVLGMALLAVIGWLATRPESPAPVAVMAPAAPVLEVPAVAEPVAPEIEAVSVPPAPLLKLTASGRSWVKVEGSDNVILLEQLLEPNAEEVVEGIPPLTVVIGDASRVKVELRGEPVDITPFTQKNVARLRLE